MICACLALGLQRQQLLKASMQDEVFLTKQPLSLFVLKLLQIELISEKVRFCLFAF